MRDLLEPGIRHIAKEHGHEIGDKIVKITDFAMSFIEKDDYTGFRRRIEAALDHTHDKVFTI